MKSFLLSMALCSLFTSASAQQVQYLTANNINAGIGIGGNLFSRLDSIVSATSLYPDTINLWDLYQAPNGLGPRAIYTATLLMSGLDSDGIQHCAGQTYKTNGCDYFDEPIAPVYNLAYDNYYRRVFKVSASQIDQFRSTWSSSINAGNVDSSIRFWPGYKNPLVANSYGVDIASGLAPFVDFNGDGIYNPLDGDYPAICGDEAIFFVFNDVRGPHLATDSVNNLGFEVRGLAYVFEQPDTTGAPYEKNAINNNVFVRYDIENKSQNSYSNFYLSLFEDPDLGCYDNDRVGCDTVRNLMFVYNGTVPDPDCGNEIGYGYVSVSHGVKMLNQHMSAFEYFTDGAVSGQSDAKLSCSTARNLSMGLWGDGSPIVIGGEGYNTDPPTTKFLFPGDPNDTSGWSEIEVANILPAGDRRMCGSVGPMNFNAGEIKHFDFAFLISYDTTSTMLGIVDTLKRDADIVQQFYDNQVASCLNGLQIASVNNISNTPLFFSVYPNPGNDRIMIESGQKIQSLEIDNILGQTVLKSQVEDTHVSLDISNLEKGVYLIVARNGTGIAVKKLVVD